MKLKSLLLAAMLAAPVTAVVAENLSPSIALNGAPPLQTAGYSLTHYLSGDFWDTITFTPVVGPSLVDASLVTIGFGATNIDFLGAWLNGTPLTLVAGPFGILEGGGLWMAPESGVLTVVVHGWAGANPGPTDAKLQAVYAGTLSVVTSVPEPASYGMMLGGLGVLAFLARRRKPS